MSVLITGASGFVGTALIEKLLKKGHRVYGMSRHPPVGSKNLVPVKGDILLPDLGIGKVPQDIHVVQHLAGIHQLGADKDGSIWETNVAGTQKVIDFCTRYQIPHLYFCSTAYTWTVNTYGKSKIICEELVKASGIPRVTIFKPSIIMPAQGYSYPGHFNQFVKLLIKVHQRGEIVRRRLEGTLRLPILEPVFRIKGNPNGKLNLIQVPEVTWGMANIDEIGTFWLTNPNPPTLQQLCDWIGEIIMVKIKVEPEFKPTPLEAGFQKMAAAFQPYLWGDDFSSHLPKASLITKEFITDTIKQAIS